MRSSSICVVSWFLLLLLPSFVAADTMQLIGSPAIIRAKTFDPAAKGAEKGQYLVEPVTAADGAVTHVNVWVEDILVDTMAPDTFDTERAIKTFRGSEGEVAVAVYADKASNKLRANGYVLDAARDVNVIKTVREGDQSRVVWQDKSGAYLTALVPRLPSRPNIPEGADKNVATEPVDAEMAERLSLPAGAAASTGQNTGNDASDTNNAVSDTDGTVPAAPGDGTNTGGDDATAVGGQEPTTGQSGDPGTGQAVVPAEQQVPPIEEPGNPYGIDPILSAEEVKTAAAAAFGQEKANGADGMALDQWGVATGGSAAVQHVAGVDGCLDATDSQLKFYPAVRAAVEKAAADKRTAAEAARTEKINQIRQAQQQAAGSGTGAVSTSTNRPPPPPPPSTDSSTTDGPTASSTDRPSGQDQSNPAVPEPPQDLPDDGDFEPGEFDE